MSKLDQFINKTIKKWKIKLIIRKSIFFTTDAKIWKKLAMIGDPTVDKAFGVNSTTQDLILINVAKHKQSTKELENTILHELLHSKHSSWSERQVRKETKRLLK